MKCTARKIDLSLENEILAEVMNYRRVTENSADCGGSDCPRCASVHLPKIKSALENREPVRFVLPGFPGKSPNVAKVLGPLPDFAEQLALNFLRGLKLRIQKIYSPGIEIILCSDGRVFSDLVGMKESDVTTYQLELSRMINEVPDGSLKTFNLDDIFGELSFAQRRDELMKRYGQSQEGLKYRVLNDSDTNRLYRGITRFLFEDSLQPDQVKSRTVLQKEARAKAYEVIRRSNAWSELIAERFPEAVRLSIHPQACGSPKLGLRLIGSETWMTPWHGVAVETQSGFVLLKRAEAEALGAELVYAASGQPSHYRLAGGNP